MKTRPALKLLIGQLAALAWLLSPAPARAQWNMGNGGPWSGGMMNHWGFFGGGFFMIIFWVLLIIGVVVLIRWLVLQGRAQSISPGQAGVPPSDRAMEILRERYASGEIDHDEFEARKRQLNSE